MGNEKVESLVVGGTAHWLSIGQRLQ